MGGWSWRAHARNPGASFASLSPAPEATRLEIGNICRMPVCDGSSMQLIPIAVNVCAGPRHLCCRRTQTAMDARCHCRYHSSIQNFNNTAWPVYALCSMIEIAGSLQEVASVSKQFFKRYNLLRYRHCACGESSEAICQQYRNDAWSRGYRCVLCCRADGRTLLHRRVGVCSTVFLRTPA
jgi:hypothetical protein